MHGMLQSCAGISIIGHLDSDLFRYSREEVMPNNPDRHIVYRYVSHIAKDTFALVMAGGRGSRLQPHTKTCPKPMLRVHGKPMLEHIIVRAKVEGFQRFVLAVEYLGHMIEDYFGDGSSHCCSATQTSQSRSERSLEAFGGSFIRRRIHKLGTIGCVLQGPPPRDGVLVCRPYAPSLSGSQRS